MHMPFNTSKTNPGFDIACFQNRVLVAMKLCIF